MTRCVRVVLALALVCATFVPGTAARAQGDTAAVAVNTHDGMSIFRFAFQVRRVMSETVETSNAAVAFASCEYCQTVAVALQVVLIMSDPSVVTPENLALALNYECTACETLASAYQYVLTTGGPVHFTPEGNQQLADLRQELIDLLLAAEGMTLDEIQAEVDGITETLRATVDQELVPASAPEPATSPSPATDATPTPSEVEESPVSSPTPEESSVPEATPTG